MEYHPHAAAHRAMPPHAGEAGPWSGGMLRVCRKMVCVSRQGLLTLEYCRAGFAGHVCGPFQVLARSRRSSLLVYCSARAESALCSSCEPDDHYRRALWRRAGPRGASCRDQDFARSFLGCYPRIVPGEPTAGLLHAPRGEEKSCDPRSCLPPELPAAREKGQAARAEGGACAPLRAGSMEKCCDGTARNPRAVQSRGARGRACVMSPHSPRHLSRPWTPSSVSISTLSAASRRWGKGGCRFGRQDTVGRTWPSNAPRCFWGRSGGSESALCRCVREVEGCARPRGMRQRRRKDTADCEACLVVCWRC